MTTGNEQHNEGKRRVVGDFPGYRSSRNGEGGFVQHRSEEVRFEVIHADEWFLPHERQTLRGADSDQQ